MSDQSIIVEGWRFLPHSYAIANQFQLLEMLKRPQLKIYHQDAPYISQDWQTVSGLHPTEAEEKLREIPAPNIDQVASATLRMVAPWNLAPSNSKKTAVFACTEWGAVTQSIIRGMKIKSLADAHGNSDSMIITASDWSKQGFIRSGAIPERVKVVPLGVDPQIYFPLNTTEKLQLRQQMGVKADDFIFLNVGLMCNHSQGIGYLLRAFAKLIERYPGRSLKLILKGRDAIFPSQDSIRQASHAVLTEQEIEAVRSRIIYVGKTLTFTELAQIYQIADVYVSPYIAEGFNLPVLEAIACGLPVICTAGGPTDDFIHPDFALPIESKLHSNHNSDGDLLYGVIPNFEHLLYLMEYIIENPEFRQQAQISGPAWVKNRFTWQQVVDQLLEILIPTVKPVLPLTNYQLSQDPSDFQPIIV